MLVALLAMVRSNEGTLQNLLGSMASSPGATSAIRDLAARAQGGAL